MKSLKKFYAPIIAVILIFFNCSSIDVIKKTNPDGNIREITVMVKNKLISNTIFEYNKNNKLIKVSKYIPTDDEPVIKRNFKYYKDGMLRMQQYNEKALKNNKNLDIIWVESYFYNKTNNLIRVETAYKSSYSIARNKTPYETTIYNYYSYDKIKKITIDGGTFKKEMNLIYENNSLVKIEYATSILNRRTRKFEAGKKLLFIYNKSKIEEIIDQLKKSTEIPESDYQKIIDEEKINNPLIKSKYSKDIDHLISYIEEDLSSTK